MQLAGVIHSYGSSMFSESRELLARMSMDVDGRTLIHEVVLADIKADRLVHIA